MLTTLTNSTLTLPAVPAAHPALADLTSAMDDALLSVLKPALCDFCPANTPAYTDPETGWHYCLPCLENAANLEDAASAEADLLEDEPDEEVMALARAIIAQRRAAV